MKAWMPLALAALAAVLALAGLAAAAAGPQETLALDDPEGDTAGPAPAAAAGFIDVVKAEATATVDGLAVAVTVASLQTDAAAPLSWELWLGTESDDVRFDVVLEAGSSTMANAEPVQDLLVGDLEGRLVRLGDGVDLATFPATLDEATQTFRATVPWDAFTTPGGATPQPGDAVALLTAGGAWHPLYVGTPHNPWFLEEMHEATTRDDAVWPPGSTLRVPLDANVAPGETLADEQASPGDGGGGRDAPAAGALLAAATLAVAAAARRRRRQ